MGKTNRTVTNMMKLLLCALAFLTVTKANYCETCTYLIEDWGGNCRGELQTLEKGPLLGCMKTKAEREKMLGFCFDCRCSSSFSNPVYLQTICDWGKNPY